eukprot:TRINITY_DN29463_c0_g1_i2.p3 TRINITY_DN29463_c0_g1~~TRINITY_DN29463_c0_g1_i2.p3  ORF type:complete len:139 (-),score=18.62 TRINITY_DN29463_c0_g1_i2:920-1336(-)
MEKIVCSCPAAYGRRSARASNKSASLITSRNISSRLPINGDQRGRVESLQFSRQIVYAASLLHVLFAHTHHVTLIAMHVLIATDAQLHVHMSQACTSEHGVNQEGFLIVSGTVIDSAAHALSLALYNTAQEWAAKHTA